MSPSSHDDAQAGFDRAFEDTKRLIANFEKGEKTYTSYDYSESQARIDFIDKFWTLLGWDVNHECQINPYEQEVKIERNVNDNGRGRRADYAFLQPNFRDVRFFVEAKRPGTPLDTPDNFFQVVRYGWNSHVPISILTNFLEFRVLDCRYKPDIATADYRVLTDFSFNYRDFSDRENFAKIYFLFSRDSSVAGAIERFSETLPTGKSKVSQRSLFSAQQLKPMDETFLGDLDSFRESLATSFKTLNPELDSDQLTEVTQRTLDRFVFMRFLEDKLIEPEPIVERLGDRAGIWEDFISASRRLNTLYNGIIFRKHSLLDSPNFQVDEEVVANIRDTLSHTNSPYAFNYVPIHILGSIYERFLSKTIVATKAKATVELKPENRKKQGVFYTPEYVVRYIVEQSIGELIQKQKPAEIAGLRFADISCGSGSFLLGLYDFIIRRHAQFYNEKGNKRIARDAGCVLDPDDGAFHLSLRQKREILLENLYGVDLDPQAVEVAQLSLYLKLLEEETTQSARHYQLEFGERLLPDLSSNVRCGNSLVEWDITEREKFTSQEEAKLKPFDFGSQFENVMASGGFDAIVGNPPYVQLSMKHFREERVNRYLPWKYGHSGGRLNTFAFFLDRARQLCKDNACFSYILPNTFTTQEYYEPLRKNLLFGSRILSLTTPVGKVFADAVVENTILVARKRPLSSSIARGSVRFSILNEDGMVVPQGETKQTEFSSNHRLSFIGSSGVSRLQRKLQTGTDILNKYVNINQAIALKHDRAACLVQRKVSSAYHKMLDGRHIERYWTGDSPNYFRFDVAKIHSCKREDIFQLEEKIFLRRVGEQMIASLDKEQKYALNTLVVITPKEECPYNLRFILALLNSRVLNFYYLHFLKSSKKVFSEIQARQVGRLPIPVLDLSQESSRQVHKRVVSLVDKLVEAKGQLHDARSEQQQSLMSAKCGAFDRQIDQLLYEVFNLDREEISQIEDAQ